jgi:hypothetical protein
MLIALYISMNLLIIIPNIGSNVHLTVHIYFIQLHFTQKYILLY